MELTKEQVEKELKRLAPRYGEKRDYQKIRFNGSGIVTTWAKNLKVARLAYFVSHGEFPFSTEYD